MIRWMAMIGVLALAACVTPEPVPVAPPTYINIEVPASLTRACNIPSPPAREVLVGAGNEAQSLVAAWALDVHEALENCAARHSGLVGVVRNYQGTIQQLNTEAKAVNG